MISYVTLVYRPEYFPYVFDTIRNKTTQPYEHLVWLNTGHPAVLAGIQKRINRGEPIRIIGSTPENTGCLYLPHLFNEAKGDIIAHIEDDIMEISPYIAEICEYTFRDFPKCKLLVADTIQDRFTRGARPPMKEYTLVNESYGLYRGAIDGWFAAFHKSFLPVLPKVFHYGLWGAIYPQFHAKKYEGYLCTAIKVFHMTSPEYAFFFDRLDQEIAKYDMVKFTNVSDWYRNVKDKMPPCSEIRLQFNASRESLNDPPITYKTVNQTSIT